MQVTKFALYGGSSQSQDMYQDTAYGVNVGNNKDYGLYWVKSQGDDIVLEIHLDAAGEVQVVGILLFQVNSMQILLIKVYKMLLKNNLGTNKRCNTS